MPASLSPAQHLRLFWSTVQCQHPSMLYAFTDESYVATHYLQGAFVVYESDLELLDLIVSATIDYAQSFGIALGTELRGYSLMNSKHGWEPLRGSFHARISIYKYLLTSLAEVNARFLVVETNEDSSLDNFANNKSRHIATHDELLRKLNSIGAVEGERISVIADEITHQNKVDRNFEKMRTDLSRIDSLSFVESNKHSGVQICDSLLYIYQRTNQEKISAHRSYKAIMELRDLVAHLYII